MKSTTTKGQSARILAWLNRGRALTPLQALQHFGCFRLGARIHDLRKAGHAIISEPIRTKDGKRVAKYRLA